MGFSGEFRVRPGSTVRVLALIVVVLSVGCRGLLPGQPASPTPSEERPITNCEMYEGGSERSQLTLPTTPTAATSTGSAQIAWKRTIDGPGTLSGDTARSVVQAHDGGYVFTGRTNDDLWIVKVNESGAPVWQTTVGGNSSDGGYDIARTADGGYVVAGVTDSFADEGAWLVKVNATGHPVWNRTLDTSMPAGGRAIVRTGDNGFAVAIENRQLAKVDASGMLEWTRSYDIGRRGDFTDIARTSDGGFAVTVRKVGVENVFSKNYSGTAFPVYEVPVVMKVDDSGERQWCRHLDSETRASAVVGTGDRGVAVAGNFGLWRLNATGHTELRYRYDRLGRARALVQTGDGGYAITGTYTHDLTLLLADREGSRRGIAILPDAARGYGLARSNDGGYVVVGEFLPVDESNQDAIVFKVVDRRESG